MEIRYMLPGELQEVSSLYAQSWKYAYKNIIPQSYLDGISAGDWVHNLKASGRKNLVMAEDNTIIGTASFCKSRWNLHEDCGEIVSIYFLPEYIGKGHGKLLLDQAIRELNRLGFENILLWVLADNQPAKSFYEKYGFALTGETQTGIIGGKTLKELLYIYPDNRKTNC